jgi:hypothetical protein
MGGGWSLSMKGLLQLGQLSIQFLLLFGVFEYLTNCKFFMLGGIRRMNA